MVLQLIYQTVVIVLLLTFSFGPAFFALINIGINQGYRTGSRLAIGVVSSDFVVCVLIISLVHFGAENFIHDEKTQRFMGIVAGIVLLVFGITHFKRPITQHSPEMVQIAPSMHSMLVKGFLLNSLNPSVWLLWLGNVTAVSKTLKYSVTRMIIYFSFTLFLVLLVELGKLLAATRLKQVLTPGVMYIINMVTGILLVIFGAVLIYNHYFD